MARNTACLCVMLPCTMWPLCGSSTSHTSFKQMTGLAWPTAVVKQLACQPAVRIIHRSSMLTCTIVFNAALCSPQPPAEKSTCNVRVNIQKILGQGDRNPASQGYNAAL